MLHGLKALIIISLALAGCVEFPKFVATAGNLGDGAALGDADAAEEPAILVDPSETFQTMDGIGANLWAFSIPGANDWDFEATQFVFDELDLHYIRLVPWLYFWETENDNADPLAINWSGFQTELQMTTWHDVPSAQWLAERGYEVTFVVDHVAEWMEQDEPGLLAESGWSELGEMIASYVLFMRDHGVHMPVVEVTAQPALGDGGESLWYDTPKRLTDAAEEVLRVLDHHGLDDVMLHGPGHHTPKEAALWTSGWLKSEPVQARTRAVSFHTWESDVQHEYDTLKQVAQAWDKPVWVTEAGFCKDGKGCDFDESHYLLPETWSTAWDVARTFYRSLAWADAARLYHWTALGHQAFVSASGQRFASFHVVKHFSNFIPPGAVRVEASVETEGLMPVVFRLPDGTWTAIILFESPQQEGELRVPLEIPVVGQLTPTAAFKSSAAAYEVDVLAEVAVEGKTRVVVPVPFNGLTSVRLHAE